MSPRRSSAPGQQSLLDVIEQAERAARQGHGTAPGCMNITAELKVALSADIKHARDEQGHELSRWEIAGRMSHLLGVDVTKTQLDNMTAPAHEHRFPAEWLAPFAIATGGRRVLEVVMQGTGVFLLPGPDALRAEVERLRQSEAAMRAERRKREGLINQMEADQ